MPNAKDSGPRYRYGHLALVLMLPLRGDRLRGIRVLQVSQFMLTSPDGSKNHRNSSFTFTHSGGNLGTAGSVAFQFERKDITS